MRDAERVVRALFDAFQRGDMEAASSLLAEGCEFELAGERLSGIDELAAFVARRRARFGGTFGYELHDVLGSEDHAVALVVLRADVDGERRTWRQVAVYHVRDGRITEAWGLEEPEPA